MKNKNNSILLDTNLWVYFYCKTDENKHNLVSNLIDKNFDYIIISSQILGELYHVLTRKKIFSKEESQAIIIELSNIFYITEINLIKVLKAMKINLTYGYAYGDSLIISTAINENCSLIYSEDMQHNQSIENKLKIVNPFI